MVSFDLFPHFPKLPKHRGSMGQAFPLEPQDGGWGLCGLGKAVLWRKGAAGQLAGGLIWLGGQDPKCGLHPQTVLADDRSWGGRHPPATLSIEGRPVRQCLHIQAARGEGVLEVSCPGQKPSWLLAAGCPDPGGGVILVTTVCLSH